jgi:hypothetical protein
MLVTIRSRTPHSTARRAAAGIGTLIATAGMGIALAPPAAAACSSYVDAGYYYSYAEGHVDTCAAYNWVRSYAQHGNRSALSAWYTGYSWASADSGESWSYSAWNQFSA